MRRVPSARNDELNPTDLEGLWTALAAAPSNAASDELAGAAYRAGRWELSPAFDLAYSYNPSGAWTASHQMSLAGKRDGFTVEDLRSVGRVARLKRGQAQRILAEITAVVSEWPRYAEQAGVEPGHIRRITPALRLRLPDH